MYCDINMIALISTYPVTSIYLRFPTIRNIMGLIRKYGKELLAPLDAYISSLGPNGGFVRN